MEIPNYCGTVSKHKYVCTLPKGHTGKHMATVGVSRILEQWDNNITQGERIEGVSREK